MKRPAHIPVPAPNMLYRPVEPDNFFGASVDRWLLHRMWAPSGILTSIKETRFDPYAQQLIKALDEKGGVESVVSDRHMPGVYTFLNPRTKEPIMGLERLAGKMPACPLLSVEDVLASLEQGKDVDEIEVLDLLQLIADDLAPARWKSCNERFPWIKDFVA